MYWLLATSDPAISSAHSLVTGLFNANLLEIVGLIVGVRGIFWILELVFTSIGMEGDSVTSNYYGTDDEEARAHIDYMRDRSMKAIYDDEFDD
jgi:hypothetical protein